MKFNDLLFTINTVLGTKYTDTDQVSVPELERAIMLVRLNVLLDAKLDVQEDVAPQIFRKFSDLNDGALFSWPHFDPGLGLLYQKDQTTTFVGCPDCCLSQLNAIFKRDMRRRHFCPDDLVLLFKDGPKDPTTLFYKLDPGDSFVIPGGREGPHEKLASIHRTAANYCPDDNCPFEEEWLNARSGNDTIIHVPPDTVVLPVPF